MPDLTITRNGELMIAHIEGDTDAGIEFVDAYMPDGVEFSVIDSGRILLRDEAIEALTTAARNEGLEIAETRQ